MILAIFAVFAIVAHAAPLAPKAAPVGDAILCQVCKDLVDAVESWVTSAPTEAELLSAIEYVCNIVPETDKAECTTLLNKYGPQLLQIIIGEIPFDQLCAGLGLCAAPPPAAAANSTLANLVANHAVIRRAKSSSECAVCELILTDIDEALTEPAIQNELIQGIETLCTSLGPLSGVCDTLIQKYTPELLGYLAKEIDPTNTCKELGLC